MISWIETSEENLETKETFNNGDFDYKMVVDVVNMEEACGDTSKGNWMVNLSVAKTPNALKKNKKTKEKLNDIANCFSMKVSELTCSDIASYGLRVTTKTIMGNNLEKMIKKVKKEAELVNMLFGFYMDKRQNAIGNTGWDFLDGNIG